MIFLCLANSILGSKYIPPWTKELKVHVYSNFDSTIICPAFLKTVFWYLNACNGQCLGGVDFTSVDLNGLPDCIACHSRCDYCSYPLLNGFCAACKPGFIIYPNLKDLKNESPRAFRHYCGPNTPCDSANGYYRDWESTSCLSCHNSCKTCWGTTVNDCLSCSSHKYLTINRTCEECDASCSTCDSSSNCLSCPNGFQLENGNCINTNLIHTVLIQINPIIVTEVVSTTSTTTETSTVTHYNYSQFNEKTEITQYRDYYNATEVLVYSKHVPNCIIFANETIINASSDHTTISLLASNASTIRAFEYSSHTYMSNNTFNLSDSTICQRPSTKTCPKETLQIITSFITTKSPFSSTSTVDYTSLITSSLVMTSRISTIASIPFDVATMSTFASNPMFLILIGLIVLIFVLLSGILYIQKQKLAILMEQMQNVEMNVAITDQIYPSKLIH